MLRDEEGHTRNSAGQLINAQGAVIPDVIDVAEMNDFDLSRECWFNQLQPGSPTSWEDIERAFLYKFLDDVEATREKEKNDKWDRWRQRNHHGRFLGARRVLGVGGWRKA
ncbi:hypothetical protein F2Q69_00059498 [Brassica cretica]|uniref:Retrotransposon gag domain-containing protein n=1 Tax=Brassica cretica TaxID=69181 RepID=A0A8S9RPF3_BRACR|nr:hypothetical protein F2Q69_00059498 [Brassica cretica]